MIFDSEVGLRHDSCESNSKLVGSLLKDTEVDRVVCLLNKLGFESQCNFSGERMKSNRLGNTTFVIGTQALYVDFISLDCITNAYNVTEQMEYSKGPGTLNDNKFLDMFKYWVQFHIDYVVMSSDHTCDIMM